VARGPKRFRKFEIFPWLGGLNALQDPQVIPATDSQTAENIVLGRDGTKRKRGGSTKRNTTEASGTNPIEGGFQYTKLDSPFDTVKTVIISNQKVLKEDEDAVYDDITGNAVVEKNVNPNFTVFNNELIISWPPSNTGSYTPLKWDQTGNVASLGGSPPNFGFSTEYNGRLYAAGDPANKRRLYASKILDAEVWTVGVTDGDPFTIDFNFEITGLVEAFGVLYIIGKETIKKLTGVIQGDIVVSGFANINKEQASILAGKVGAVNHSAIVSTANDVFFLGSRGAHSLLATDKFGSNEQAFISFKIQDFYANELNHSQSTNWRGIFDETINSVLWAVSSKNSTTLDTVLGYNIELKEWFTWKINTSSLFTREKNGIREPFAGGQDGFVRRINDFTSFSDDGAGYKATLKTAFIDFGDSNLLKRVLKLGVIYVPKGKFTCNVDYCIDNQGVSSTSFTMEGGCNTTVLGEFQLDCDRLGAAPSEIKNVLIKGVGRNIEISLSNDTAGQDMEILGYIIQYVPLKNVYDNAR